ncbi:pyruvate phosphate dikinase [Eubacterium sulci ATCC 35585]|nr:pyruvate phosphate dikinase [Eubacterium sulci ATCC 35585]EUC78500.1 pyruvate, phosphate dikinase [Eubacterium sulci ATCC 35585]
MKHFVYSFNEGSKDMRSLLGGKGANLAEMTKIGLPVPFGFTITTEACNEYYRNGGKLGEELISEIKEKLSELENVTGKTFGSTTNPLLVSVRSGSVFSMPGMMDTILNLGLNDESTKGLADLTENRRFALDSFRRFIQMYGNVVMEIDGKNFEDIIEKAKHDRGIMYDIDLDEEALCEIIDDYKKVVRYGQEGGFPSDPKVQLIEAVKAVFRSWNNDRAIRYRRMERIPDSLGTAVNVQSMVFGNMGNTSGTGVAFTRSPVNGDNHVYGEFLVNAQGEDVVAGIRTPKPISEMAESFPEVYEDFMNIAKVLEQHYKDAQDMEFTVERNKLYMLQTRAGKRTAQSAVKIAVDMEREGLIDRETAVMRIEPGQIDQLLHPRFDEEELKGVSVIAKGLPASPGAVSGKIYFNALEAEAAVKKGEKAILVRETTSPEDLAGMIAAGGILTAKGGVTSHAAVVARQMGKCCVAGCSEILVSEDKKELKTKDKVYREGDVISLDGYDGKVYEGEIHTVEPNLSGDFGVIMSWADGIRSLKIRTNADKPEDALKALEFGAEGIGLCRTEHMFFEENRIPAIRRMIVADTESERREALDALLPYQKNDFRGIYEVMKENPVTIRLLDPPLHEFLPHTDAEIRSLAEKIGVPYEKLVRRTDELHENNPMLGHRGCRLAISYPEIAEMQTRAIMEAAIEVSEEKGYSIVPEIMIPLTSSDKEMAYIKDIVAKEAERCKEEKSSDIKYVIGTMIETPRAALTADEIAESAEFFSFGTNDMTQMTYGFSRDDTAKIIETYIEKNIFEEDIFRSIDEKGVGKLLDIAVKLGRQTRNDLKIGICGEHGGDPRSIEFCHKLGLNYVSCSPYRVPIARIAAAQAAIKCNQE